ncbi:DUF3313 domain-containing protein [Pseudomonas sp. UMAB-08]|uniref:DUF3313 domain-containing protein n=1 Tax=Pseudomonas sp. UMAB-08 TaxID=1365375 RepID=UPI001C5639CE|nr:DUF3313 domain-containing protein [Pseudomonas sp. UMAB-08]
MKASRKWLVGIALSSLLLGGCVSKVTEKEQFSGFLPNYDGLQETTSSSGKEVLRWVAPDFKPGAYSTVVFNELELYPAPKPTDRVDMKTLRQIQAYASSSAKGVLSQRYRVVNSLQAVPPGSRTLIMHAAITGVTASNEGMQWYEVVPVAAVVGAASAASGHRDQNSELYIEASFVDAATGSPVVKVVRKVFGKTLKNESQAITVDDFKAAIDGLAGDMRAFIK